MAGEKAKGKARKGQRRAIEARDGPGKDQGKGPRKERAREGGRKGRRNLKVR